MMHDVVGMVLIAVLFVLVVASLAVLPGEGRTAPRLPKSSAPRQRRSAAWLSVSLHLQSSVAVPVITSAP